MRPSPTAGPLFKLVDRLTAAFAAVAAWLFVAAGAMLVVEVVARYVFVAPTVWAAELSLLCLIWATYLAAAALLRQRRHITITAVTQRLPQGWRRVTEALSLAVVLIVCLAAVWYGADIALDSLQRGRTTGSMLNLPAWATEASIPIGFTLIALQALVELARLGLGGRAAIASPPPD